jgi:hypothetical protein
LHSINDLPDVQTTSDEKGRVMTTMFNVSKKMAAALIIVVSVFSLAGCQTSPTSGGANAPGSATTGASVTASDAALATRSGFLTDYARLAPMPGGDGVRCWKRPDVAWKTYDKVLITRMQVTLKPGANKRVDPTDLKMLLDYFHNSLVAAFKPQMQVVDKAGPGVLVMRVALTDLTPTNVADSVVGTAVPYGFAAEVASGAATGLPAGATPYLGETGIETQLRDGATNAIVAECEDTEIGRKYAADLNAGAGGAAQAWVGGYLSSFSSWSYAKDAFDKWAALTARRLAVLRAA